MPTPVKQAPKVIAITAWSFSRFNDHKKCPAYAKYKHVDRIQEPGSPALDRGSEIHSIAQRFSLANGRAKTPAELKTFEQEFRDLQKRKNIMTEQQWGFDGKWRPTAWFDERGTPPDRQVRCRVVVDCAYMDLERNVLVVIDHKTGKINPGHLDQLSLYAMAGLLQFPDCSGVEVKLWYLDHGVEAPTPPRIYLRSELGALKKEWEKKTKPMLNDRRFPPKPSSNCSYCFYSKAKSGPCKF